MEKLANRIVVFFLVLLTTSAATAQSSDSQKDQSKKIGYVRSESFYDPETGIGELVTALSSIDLAMKSRVAKLVEINNKIKNFYEDWEKCMTSMWCGEGKSGFLDAKKKEAQTLQEQFVVSKAAYDAELSKLKESEVFPVEIKIQTLLRQYRKQKGFDLIIDISRSEVEKMNYSVFDEPSPDITKDFIQFCKNQKDQISTKDFK